MSDIYTENYLENLNEFAAENGVSLKQLMQKKGISFMANVEDDDIDETEPGGVPFDSGNPLQEYKDQAVRSLVF